MMPASIFSKVFNKQVCFIFFVFVFLFSMSQSFADFAKPNYISEDVGFSIFFPGSKPFEEIKETDKSTLTVIMSVKNNVGYTVRAREFDSELKPEHVPIFLKDIKKVRTRGGKVVTEKKMMFNGEPALQVKYISSHGAKTYMRIFNKGRVWYNLQVYSINSFPSSKDANYFFDSFQFK